MQITIQHQEKQKLEFSIAGADHTLLNMLIKQVQQDSDVVAAAYNIAHPLVGNPSIIIQTKKKDPQQVLVDAIKALQKLNDGFLKEFNKAFA